MLEKILRFYNNNISPYSLVFKHFKFRFKLFWVLLPLTLICFVGVISTVFSLPSIIVFTPLLATTILLFLWINYKAKNILEIRYKIKPTEFFWRNESFENMQFELLREYLSENGLMTEAKIKILIDMLLKESEHRKMPSLIAPSFILAMFIPLWNQVTRIMFLNVTDEKNAIIQMFAVIAVVVIVALPLGFLKTIYADFKGILFDVESERMKNLAILLEDVLLRLPT